MLAVCWTEWLVIEAANVDIKPMPTNMRTTAMSLPHMVENRADDGGSRRECGEAAARERDHGMFLASLGFRHY